MDHKPKQKIAEPSSTVKRSAKKLAQWTQKAQNKMEQIKSSTIKKIQDTFRRRRIKMQSNGIKSSVKLEPSEKIHHIFTQAIDSLAHPQARKDSDPQ